MNMNVQTYIVALLLSFPCPIVAGPLHAQCRLEWRFGITCYEVYTALVTQIKQWTTAHGCQQGGERCLYELQSADPHYIVAKHTNLVHNYVDDLSFKLQSCERRLSCYVTAFSVSEPWYIVLDNGINYCNLHNLVDGSGLTQVPKYIEWTNDFMCTQYSKANCTVY